MEPSFGVWHCSDYKERLKGQMLKSGIITFHIGSLRR